MTVYVCPVCGQLMGAQRLVNGKVPDHWLGDPISDYCAGGEQDPEVLDGDGKRALNETELAALRRLAEKTT